MRNITKPETPEVNRRSFLKVAGRGLVAGLAFYTASNILGPSIANSQGPETRNVAGHELRVVELSESLEKVEEKSEHYPKTENTVKKDGKDVYLNARTVPEKVSFTVGLGESMKAFSFRLYETGKVGETSIENFVRIVKEDTGKDITKVKILIEKGSYEEGGKSHEFINAYVLPVNEEGNPITHRGEGEYLIYGATQMGEKVFAKEYVMKDPDHKIVVASR